MSSQKGFTPFSYVIFSEDCILEKEYQCVKKHPNAAGIIALLYLGFVGSGLGQVTWTRALSILPASTCSLFYPLQPLFSALLGALLLHETFKPAFFAGLILISLDVVLNTLETRRQAEGK